MTTDKLYRLMDLLEDLKKIDSIISIHRENPAEASDIMLSQYLARKDQLLVYFINEINAAVDLDYTPQRLNIIKQIMEKFHHYHPLSVKHDKSLDQLEEALSA